MGSFSDVKSTFCRSVLQLRSNFDHSKTMITILNKSHGFGGSWLLNPTPWLEDELQ